MAAQAGSATASELSSRVLDCSRTCDVGQAIRGHLAPACVVPAITFGQLTHALTDSTVWDVRVGRFVSARQDDPSSGDPTIPGRFDNVTGVSSGAPQQIGAVTLIRTTAKATLSHYQPGLFAA